MSNPIDLCPKEEKNSHDQQLNERTNRRVLRFSPLHYMSEEVLPAQSLLPTDSVCHLTACIMHVWEAREAPLSGRHPLSATMGPSSTRLAAPCLPLPPQGPMAPHCKVRQRAQTGSTIGGYGPRLVEALRALLICCACFVKQGRRAETTRSDRYPTSCEEKSQGKNRVPVYFHVKYTSICEKRHEVRKKVWDYSRVESFSRWFPGSSCWWRPFNS